MISREYQCVYIHIPKTAGTSIETWFDYHGEEERRGRQDHRSLKHLQQAIWPSSRGRFGVQHFIHFVNQRYKARRMDFACVTQNEYQTFFKFAIVRNPWDRVYSWYRNVMRDEIHQHELGVPAGCEFDDFLVRHLDNWALEPQMFWLRDAEDKMGLDYVGKFEELQQAFDVICERLGVADSSLPKKLDSGTSDFRSGYSGPGRDIVAGKYAEEIKMFNYSFD